MKLRLDKMLSNTGYGSRKQIKSDAKAGHITINDTITKDSSKIINTETDTVKYKNQIVTYIEYIYLMMNKPSGVVSATEDNYDKTVIDLLQKEDKFFQPFPVGRLDKDTEGLLLLTNNGKLCHNLLSPKKHVDKTYYAEIEGKITEEDIIAFKEGVIFTDDNYKTMPALLQIIESDNISKCYITIKEGKFHQVKRMVQAVDKEVIYLKRLSMGTITLDKTLKLGEYRKLNPKEMVDLEQYM